MCHEAPFTMSRILALLLVVFSAVSAFSPGVNAAAAVRSSPAVSMNTKYTVAAGLAKKKNPKTGSSLSLKGYQVGSRAPARAVSSGTTIKDIGGKYKNINPEMGAPKNKQNVPTFLALGVPIALYAILSSQ